MLYKTFAAEGRHYVYDTVSNNILIVSKKIAGFLDKKIPFGKLKEKEKELVKKFKKDGLLRTEGFSKFKFDFFDNFDNYFALTKSDVKKLTIVITEQCNFGCRYCLYGGGYKYRKQLSGAEISLKTAKRAVDFYFKNSGNIRQKNITFYGGEPLVDRERLFEIIIYARKKYRAENLRINLTTNGSLIDKRFVDFFSDNKVFINISLDGPGEIQDRFRIKKTGEGTYNLIQNRLEFIKKYNREYFDRFVAISVTVNPPYEFNLLEKYFEESDLLRSLRLDLSYVEEKDAGQLAPNLSSRSLYRLKAEKESLAIRECTGKLLREEKISDLYRNIFFSRLKTIQYRDKAKMGDVLEIKGPCFPGLSMVLVSVKGNFHICTMLDDEYRIGDVENGLDSERTKKAVGDIYKFIKSNCKNCWAVRLCHPCLAKFNRKEFLPKRSDLCFYRQAVLLESLKSYIKINNYEKIKL